MAAIEVSKEMGWNRKFLSALEDIPGMDRPITLYCANKVDISNTKDSRHRMRISTLIVSIMLLRVLWRFEIW